MAWNAGGILGMMVRFIEPIIGDSELMRLKLGINLKGVNYVK